MTKRVVLDAMIRRTDFALQAESVSVELGTNIKLEELSGNSPLAKFVRKPDFQRETNHWAPSQVVGLIKSFATGELIPSLILWKAESFVFVIDGAHRLSALKAWIEDDYGDGVISHGFYSGNVPEDQKAVAKYTRALVEKEVGKYQYIKSLSEESLSLDPSKAKMHSMLFSRSLSVQWIPGGQEVAESSFFKINSQGTTLDSTEELLLRNRRKSYAIGARSIVRAGTGHKYWSGFSGENQGEIEVLALAQNELLFQPSIKEPIKTLDLPLGGTSSPVDALKTLIDIFSIVDGYLDSKKGLGQLSDDPDGSQTVELLRRVNRVTARLTGNDPSSLGLHPAVYFYNERGSHSRFMFLGVVKVISDAVRNNDKAWFRKFSDVRKHVEGVLIGRKSLINQGLANVNSGQRIGRVAELFKFLVRWFSENETVEDKDILKALGLEGAAGSLTIIDAPKGFSQDVKSAVFLQAAIMSAPRCPICGGLLQPTKSVSYDHIVPVSIGGAGTISNAQLTHPFCNTGVKGADMG